MPAQFTADLNPKNTGISLSDMMKIGLYSAEADVLNRQAQIAREKEAELPLIKSAMADPENKLPDGSWDIRKITQILPAIAPVSGAEYATKIVDMTRNHIEANKSLNELSQQERGILGSIYSAHAAAGTQDPRLVINSLNSLKAENPNLSKLIDLKIDALRQVPAGPEFNKNLYQARNEVLTPTQVIDQFAPKATLGDVGGQQKQITTQPSVMGEAPKITVSDYNAGTGGASPTGGAKPIAGAGGEGKTTPTGGNLRDLVPKSDYNYTDESQKFNLSELQKARQSKGEEDFKTANISAGLANESKQSIRKIKEYVNQATGSVPGQTVRKLGQWFAGNPELETLIKNNADLYVRNAQTMGGTDKANADVKAITGSENITAEALKGIVQRFEASATSAEMYQRGMKALRDKRGSINGAISTEDYKYAWNQNADPRVFMLLDINNSNLSDSEKAKERAKLGEGMSAEEKKKFKEKAENIVALEKGIYK